MGKKTLLSQIQRLLDGASKPKQRKRRMTRDEYYDNLAVKFAEERLMSTSTPTLHGE